MTLNPKLMPVILCGGAGTRLWPLSRQAFPKQFAVELDQKSLLDLTVERVRAFENTCGCLAVTGEDYRFMVADALAPLEVAEILLEPCARNTAPAICAAAVKTAEIAPDAILVILPSDHFVPDTEAFVTAINEAAGLASQGWWVTLGIKPDKPSSAYGYIEPGTKLDASPNGSEVTRFIEKPARETAQKLVDQGCFWNAGIFIVQAQTAADLIEKHVPEIFAAASQSVADMTADHAFRRLDPAAFEQAPAISIDYAVLEKEHRVAVVPYEATWSDLGSWDAIANSHVADEDGNRAEGDVLFAQSKNSFAYSPDRLAVVLGLDDVVVVDTADAVLVASRDKTDEVKAIVENLKAAERPEYSEHRKVARPWGTFESIDRGARYQVKRITVKPGAQLSLQYHHHRAEHWIVVKGTAKVTRDAETFLLRENESTFIPLGAVHRLENPGKTELELIEVQSGTYLGEDDIVRVEDVYGREKPSNSAVKRAPSTPGMKPKLKRQNGP